MGKEVDGKEGEEEGKRRERWRARAVRRGQGGCYELYKEGDVFGKEESREVK